MRNTYRNLRWALHSLKRAPGFTVAVVFMLAVSVGVNGTALTVVDRLLFRAPIGVADPARVVKVSNSWILRYEQYVQLATDMRLLSVGAESARTELLLEEDVEPEPIYGRFVSFN